MARHRRRPSLILEHLEGRLLLDAAPGPSPIPVATPGQFRRVQARPDDRDGPGRRADPPVVAPRAERPTVTVNAGPAAIPAAPMSPPALPAPPPARPAAMFAQPTLFTPARVAEVVARAVPLAVSRPELLPLATLVFADSSAVVTASPRPGGTAGLMRCSGGKSGPSSEPPRMT